MPHPVGKTWADSEKRLGEYLTFAIVIQTFDGVQNFAPGRHSAGTETYD
jgi:hypothetical protein